MKKIILLAIVLGLFTSRNLLAQTGNCDRCGSYIICEGITKWEVIDKCGEPDYHEQYANSEKFIYNDGSGSFIHILEFRDGTLINLSVGGKPLSRQPQPQANAQEK